MVKRNYHRETVFTVESFTYRPHAVQYPRNPDVLQLNEPYNRLGDSRLVANHTMVNLRAWQSTLSSVNRFEKAPLDFNITSRCSKVPEKSQQNSKRDEFTSNVCSF